MEAMEERLRRIAEVLGFELQEKVKHLHFCITSRLLTFAIGGDVLVFGKCTAKPSEWHAFVKSSHNTGDHPLNYLKPAVKSQVRRTLVATFDPKQVEDTSLQEVFKRMFQNNSLQFVLNA